MGLWTPRSRSLTARRNAFRAVLAVELGGLSGPLLEKEGPLAKREGGRRGEGGQEKQHQRFI